MTNSVNKNGLVLRFYRQTFRKRRLLRLRFSGVFFCVRCAKMFRPPRIVCRGTSSYVSFYVKIRVIVSSKEHADDVHVGNFDFRRERAVFSIGLPALMFRIF